MKVCNPMCAVILLSASVISCLAQDRAPAKTASPIEQALVASEKTLIEAKKKDDGAFLKRIVSEDFSLVGVDGKLLQQQEAVGDLGDSELVELPRALPARPLKKDAEQIP